MSSVCSRGWHVERVLGGGEVVSLEVRRVALLVDCAHQEHVAGGSGGDEDTVLLIVFQQVHIDDIDDDDNEGADTAILMVLDQVLEFAGCSLGLGGRQPGAGGVVHLLNLEMNYMNL